MRSMKVLLALLLMFGLFAISLAGGYFYYGQQVKEVEQNRADTDGVIAYGQTSESVIPSATLGRVEPENQLGAALEFGMEIVPGQNLTEAVFDGMVVRQVEVRGNDAVLKLEKNGVEVLLPTVGVIGVRKTVDGDSVMVPVRELGSVLEPGDVLQLRGGFVGSNITMTQEEMIASFQERIEGMDYFEERMAAIRTFGAKRMTETEFVERLLGNPVRFGADELMVLSVSVKP